MRLRFLAVLGAVSVLTVAAVGQSAAPVDGPVQLEDFDASTNMLRGYPYPEANNPPGYFHRVENTQHLPATIPNPNNKYPPNPIAPCSAQMKVWNNVISRVPEGPGRANALLGVLTRLSQHQCCVDMVRDETSSPPTILSLRPDACPEG